MMEVFTGNSTIGTEGLCPMFLTFEILSRPARRLPAETQLQREKEIEMVMKVAERTHEKKRISFGLRHTGGPKRGGTTKKLQKLRAGAPVLVYRTT